MKELLIESKSRMLTMLEKNYPEHPAIKTLQLELLLLYSQSC